MSQALMASATAWDEGQRHALAFAVELMSVQAVMSAAFLQWPIAITGPAKARRDDLLMQRDGLRQQQLTAQGHLEEQIK